MDLTLSELVGVIRDGGVTGALLLIVVGLIRGWLVPRWQYDRDAAEAERVRTELIGERDYWRDVALKGMALAERAVDR